MPKYEGIIQSSGEAQYANDIPPMPNEVFGAFVLSTVHSGRVDKIDTAEVLVSKIKSLVSIHNSICMLFSYVFNYIVNKFYSLIG